MTPKEKQDKIEASSNPFFVSMVHEEKELSTSGSDNWKP